MMGSRTDRLREAITAELEDQRPALDAGTPLTSVSVIVHLHENGAVRRVQVRADRQRDMRGDGRRMLDDGNTRPPLPSDSLLTRKVS